METRILLSVAAAAMMAAGCTRALDTDILATYPDIAEVFLDEFASDMDFQAWGKATNFSIDYDEKYEGRSAMRIEVPVPSDPQGNFAGGIFFSSIGRDLTGYDALTFYAKSSVTATMVAGIGNFADTDHMAQVDEVELTTSWTKVIIPVPNPAKLVAEYGLFYYSAGAVNNESYTIWIDDVRYEKLGTLAHYRIQPVEKLGIVGSEMEMEELTQTVNLPNGRDCRMTVSSSCFTFESSDSGVAEVDGNRLRIRGAGEAEITVKEADGEITVRGIDIGTPEEPDRPASEVLSLYSDSYENAVGVNWNAMWQWSTAVYDELGLSDGGHIGWYTDLNFVGITFNSPLDCSEMTHLHIDMLSVGEVSANTKVSVSVFFNTGTDGSGSTTFNEVKVPVTQAAYPDFSTGKWLPVDIELPENQKGTGIVTQLSLSCDADTSTGDVETMSILIDNVYFY